MKIIRSTKCALKYTTAYKRSVLQQVLNEYGNVVNQFIDQFWPTPPRKGELLKPVVDSVDTWFSHRLRKVAAREAIDMVLAVTRKGGETGAKPHHTGQRMAVSSTIAALVPAQRTVEFDAWLQLRCIGNHFRLDLPVQFHKHFHKWNAQGQRLNSYVITPTYVQFAFEVETGPKREPERTVGIDTGILALATTSGGRKYGQDIPIHLARIRRCKHGSKGQQRARRALRQRIAEVAKEVVQSTDLVVMERLKGITKNTKGRIPKRLRRSIGSWNVGYWFTRVQQQCEENRVSFRTVPAWNTSITCPSCAQVDRKNRDKGKFLCQACGYTGDADVTAAKNILSRFLTGPYGAGCKPTLVDHV